MCVDRYQGVRNMVRFHNYAGTAKVANWYDDEANLGSFSRGDRAFFAVNNATSSKTATVHTGLGKGVYCDVVHGKRFKGACTGPKVRVGAGDTTTITVKGKDSVAFDRAGQDLLTSAHLAPPHDQQAC